ncbi:hypothetical protein CO045_02485 [Candidatus Peregrinibacteria bacterium CG_4_9_14_0_2_um_filter_41_14]|nr:MAG: hypothetical protein CO045_02485 [Candidatus Peregrinibacteria bacterium CG_4_9_14_0_2_um_filter_41_14]
MHKKYCLLEVKPRVGLNVSVQAMAFIVAGLVNLRFYFRWWRRIFGRPKFSLEVVRINEVLHFYLYVPKVIKPLVKQLFYAHYKLVEVEEVRCGYVINDAVRVLDIKFVKKSDPVELDFDFMNVLLSGLSEMKYDGGVQILLRRNLRGDQFRSRLRFFVQRKELIGHLYNLLNGAREWGRVNGYKVKLQFVYFARKLRLQRRLLILSGCLTPESVASLYHLPLGENFGFKLNYLASYNLLSPNLQQNFANDVILGETEFRGRSKLVPFKEIDRSRHFYVVGKTGMGKSTLLLNMLEADIKAGRGVALIDPHGDLVEQVLSRIPKERINDVVYINPSDYDNPIAFNVFESFDAEGEMLIASGLISVFKKLYQHSWGPRLEYILRNTILSLLKCPNANLLMVSRLLNDDLFRQKILPKIDDPVLQMFWLKEFNQMHDRMRNEAVAPIQNKVGQFLANPVLRNILGQTKSTIDLSFAMDKQKIVLINLAKGLIGEDNSFLLGSLLVTKFQLAAMQRAKINPTMRKNFYLYIDEFQNFVNESFVTILAEARKYGLCLSLANQYLEQIPEEIMAAIVGNVGSLMSFQVGIADAKYLTEQMGADVLVNDLLMLPKYNAYMRLLNDGMPTTAFKIKSLASVGELHDEVGVAKIKRVSRQRYNNKRAMVEQQIKRMLVH